MKKKDAFFNSMREVIKEAISFHDTTQKEIAEKDAYVSSIFEQLLKRKNNLEN